MSTPSELETLQQRFKDSAISLSEAERLIALQADEIERLKDQPLKWIPEVKRVEDMSAKGYLKIMRDVDGDVIVAVHGMCDGVVQHCEAVEFCVGRGGNRSPNTVNALIRLAEAMEKDNAERPIQAPKPEESSDAKNISSKTI